MEPQYTPGRRRVNSRGLKDSIEFSEYNFQNGIAYKREAKTGLPLKEDLMKLLEESENRDAI